MSWIAAGLRLTRGGGVKTVTGTSDIWKTCL